MTKSVTTFVSCQCSNIMFIYNVTSFESRAVFKNVRIVCSGIEIVRLGVSINLLLKCTCSMVMGYA